MISVVGAVKRLLIMLLLLLILVGTATRLSWAAAPLSATPNDEDHDEHTSTTSTNSTTTTHHDEDEDEDTTTTETSETTTTHHEEDHDETTTTTNSTTTTEHEEEHEESSTTETSETTTSTEHEESHTTTHEEYTTTTGNVTGSHYAHEAIEEIREAEAHIAKAEARIQEALSKGYNVTSAINLLDAAKDMLSKAKNAYEKGDYRRAKAMAKEAEVLAKKAQWLAEFLMKKGGKTENMKVENKTSDKYVVLTQDNKVEFSKNKPKVEVYYISNKGSMKFEATRFMLVEFSGSKVLKVVKFDEIAWTSKFETRKEGDNTIVIVTYYANSSDYEIVLVMYVAQKPLAMSLSSRNATIVFTIAGGADEVKFDLIVKRWSWVGGASSKLALVMKMESEFKGEVYLRSTTIDEDQIIVKLDGFGVEIAWVRMAEIRDQSGNSTFVNVTVSYRSMELKANPDKVGLELTVNFTYPYFGSSQLIHDPSIGIVKDISEVLPSQQPTTTQAMIQPSVQNTSTIFDLITPELLAGTAMVTVIVMLGFLLISRVRRR